ncbi:MAG: toxic anion resistance protein, partial [Oscillospiraceae bacterium]|nr:toxic anion resistance protein [Oscillospiraceae bacterium]
MAENNEFVPQLTLNPDAMGAAAAVAAPEPAAPAFTLEQDNAAIADSVASQKKSLSAEEQAMVDAFAKQIDITDTNTILTYGSASQKHISDFADSALSTVRTKDLGEVGDMLSDLVVELKGFNFDEKEKKGLFGLRKKAANKMEGLKADYAKAEVNVEKITEMLEKHQVTLMKDTAMLDKMYETNQGYFKELTMYILAGKQRLEECQTVTLPALQKKA